MTAKTRFLGALLAASAAGCIEPANTRPVPQVDSARVAPPSAAPARTPAPPAAAKLPAEPALSDYLACAALHNPGLEAAFHAWKAALEAVPQARALPDPRFTYGYYIREVETRVGPQRNSLQLAQTLPWLGKLELRAGAADDAARAARHRYDAAKLALFRRVKDAYYGYYYLGRAVAVTRENTRLLRHLEGVVRTKYKTSAVKHADFIRIQVELGKLADRLRSLTEMRSPVIADLLAAANLPAGRELPWPKEIVPAKMTATDEQLAAWAARSNPHLKELDTDVARRRQQVELARKEYFPDVTLGLTWIDTDDAVGRMRPHDSGTDPLIAMVSVNLPIWWDKIKAGIRQARFEHLAALKHKADAANELTARVKLAAYHCRDAQGKIDLYRRVLIPRATEAMKVIEAAFPRGGASFSDLIDAQRVLLEFQLTHERALADRGRRLAELEMLVGRELPRPPGGAATRPAARTRAAP